MLVVVNEDGVVVVGIVCSKEWVVVMVVQDKDGEEGEEYYKMM